MEELLPLNFYYSAPVDFEHKNYLILNYLAKVDKSYGDLILSPYLLWTEKLTKEIKDFNSSYIEFRNSLKKDMIGFNYTTGIQYSKINTLKELEEIIQIVDYSLPLLESRIQLGYRLNNRYPQLLY